MNVWSLCYLFCCRKYRMADDYDKLIQEYQQMNKRAFVLGYTGVIGKELVKTILSSHIFSKIVLIGRRTVTYEDELYKDVVSVSVETQKRQDNSGHASNIIYLPTDSRPNKGSWPPCTLHFTSAFLSEAQNISSSLICRLCDFMAVHWRQLTALFLVNVYILSTTRYGCRIARSSAVNVFSSENLERRPTFQQNEFQVIAENW